MIVKKQVKELHLWKEINELTKKVNTLTNEGLYLEDRHLRALTRKAALTAINSIEHGYERETNIDFLRFLDNCLDALEELESRLYEAMDRDIIDIGKYTEFYKENRECCRMVTSLMNALKDTGAFRQAG